MEVQRVTEPQANPLLDPSRPVALPVRRAKREPRYSLLVHARRRRILANVMVVASSVLMLAGAYVCYLLLE